MRDWPWPGAVLSLSLFFGSQNEKKPPPEETAFSVLERRGIVGRMLMTVMMSYAG
jgi:hypothetical protein